MTTLARSCAEHDRRSPSPSGRLPRYSVSRGPGRDSWPGNRGHPDGGPDADLAPPTDTTPATHRVDVNTEGSGGIEDGGPGTDISPTTGRSEDHLDEGVGRH